MIFNALSKEKYKSLGAGLSQQMTFCSNDITLGQSSETIYVYLTIDVWVLKLNVSLLREGIRST